MAIRVITFDVVPMIDENNQIVEEVYATLQIKVGELIVANPRVPRSYVPEDVQVGDELLLVKA